MIQHTDIVLIAGFLKYTGTHGALHRGRLHQGRQTRRHPKTLEQHEVGKEKSPQLGTSVSATWTMRAASDQNRERIPFVWPVTLLRA